MATVEVPLGAKAIIVTDQLLAHYTDWTRVPAEGVKGHIEARVVPTKDPNVVDVLTRYVAPDD